MLRRRSVKIRNLICRRYRTVVTIRVRRLFVANDYIFRHSTTLTNSSLRARYILGVVMSEIYNGFQYRTKSGLLWGMISIRGRYFSIRVARALCHPRFVTLEGSTFHNGLFHYSSDLGLHSLHRNTGIITTNNFLGHLSATSNGHHFTRQLMSSPRATPLRNLRVTINCRLHRYTSGYITKTNMFLCWNVLTKR